MINWHEINLKNKTNGQIKVLCPSCSHTRKKKNDPCLSVNLDKGVANCHNCGETSVRDRVIKEYKLPSQEWQNHTSISDKIVKWFRDERKISQQTLIDCKITEEKYYQPALKKEVNNVVFNYFQGVQLINKKYRSGGKCFTQTAGTKKILYGLNDIIGRDEIFIVEGEMDKLAMWEAGIKNCVSVPNGSKDLDGYFETCRDYLKDLKKIFIAVDTDEDGRNLERELIKRFGKWRCARIEFDGEKDANDLLKRGIMCLQNACENPIYYPVDGTFTAADVKDELLGYYDQGRAECIEPKSHIYKEFNKVFKILMGQLTVVTGISSHGKSNWLEDYVLNLIQDHNLKASFYSPEHFPMETHHSVLTEKVIGKPFLEDYYDNPRMSREDVEKYIEWSKDKVYFTYPEKGVSMGWKWLLDKFKEQLFRYGIDIFIIDAFNKVKRDNPDSLGEINQILSELTAFVQAYNVHVFLIAHPTKMQKNKQTRKYEVPSLYDVKGSGDFRDQTHNGLCVYRDFEKKTTTVINLKTKFKHQGEITGFSEFEFDPSNGRYYNSGGHKNRLPLFENEGLTPQMALEPIYEISEDELPF